MKNLPPHLRHLAMELADLYDRYLTGRINRCQFEGRVTDLRWYYAVHGNVWGV